METQEETQMNTAAECRAKALEKILQAEQDKNHRRKLLSAAEAWLFLAERLDELDHVAVAFDDDFDTNLRSLETKPSVAALASGSASWRGSVCLIAKGFFRPNRFKCGIGQTPELFYERDTTRHGARCLPNIGG